MAKKSLYKSADHLTFPTRAEDCTAFHWYEQEFGSYNRHRNQTVEENRRLFWVMFACSDVRTASTAWNHEQNLLCLNSSWCWCNGVGNVSRCTFGPLIRSIIWKPQPIWGLLLNTFIPLRLSKARLRLIPWTWQWVRCTLKASRSESSRDWGCFGGTGDSQHECVTEKSAITVQQGTPSQKEPFQHLVESLAQWTKTGLTDKLNPTQNYSGGPNRPEDAYPFYIMLCQYDPYFCCSYV